MKTIFITLILFYSSIVLSQNVLSGKIVTANNNTPIEFATVYLNNTLQGTISNTNGFFSLNISNLPAELIIRHVAHETLILNIKKVPNQSLNIRLKEKSALLREFVVSDDNLREENINYFKNWFLGSDIWGKSAEILNDSVLIFQKTYANIDDDAQIVRIKTTKANQARTPQNPLQTQKICKHFQVYTTAPLQVHLPELGYFIEADIRYFAVILDSISQRYYGINNSFYYFKEEHNLSRKQLKRIQQNREAAYQNSRTHFCKCLYHQTLNQNNYTIYERIINDTTHKIHYEPFKLYEHTTLKGDLLMVNNLVGKTLDISYGQNIKLNSQKGKHSHFQLQQRSSVQFQKEPIIIRKDGTTPNANIMFGGKIGRKKVGALLPTEYSPVIQH